MMKAKIQLHITYTSGAPTTTVTVAGPLEVKGTKLNDHDLAGLLFACEFAINSGESPSKSFGKPVRAWFSIEQDKP